MLWRFQDGIKQKIIASHNLNATSSRSHCIFTLYVESVDKSNPDDKIKAKFSLGRSCRASKTAYIVLSCLLIHRWDCSFVVIVDLAGSERVVKTGATGTTFPSIYLYRSISIYLYRSIYIDLSLSIYLYRSIYIDLSISIYLFRSIDLSIYRLDLARVDRD